MPRFVACSRCGKPNRKPLCDACRSDTYGSAEYQANSGLIKHAAKQTIQHGLKVVCVICGQLILNPHDVTIEHIRPVGAGGTNRVDNLGPAHSRCNYAKRAAYL